VAPGDRTLEQCEWGDLDMWVHWGLRWGHGGAGAAMALAVWWHWGGGTGEVTPGDRTQGSMGRGTWACGCTRGCARDVAVLGHGGAAMALAVRWPWGPQWGGGTGEVAPGDRTPEQHGRGDLGVQGLRGGHGGAGARWLCGGPGVRSGEVALGR